MDEGAWKATVHGVAKSQTRLRLHFLSFFLLSMQYYVIARNTVDWDPALMKLTS